MTTEIKNKKYIYIKDKEYYMQVMDMAKYITMGKGQVIKKLFKNMIIDKKKGANNWEEKKETMLKSRSFYEEAEILKKFEKFETIKLLFLVSRSLEEVMKDSNSSLEERAFCRLAENQVISIALKQCKTRYPNMAKATLKEFKMLGRELRLQRRRSPSLNKTHSASFRQHRYLLICAYRLLGGGKKYQSLMKMADDLIKHKSKQSSKVKKSVVSPKVTPMVGVNQQEVGSCELVNSPAANQKPNQCTQEAQLETKKASHTGVSERKACKNKGIRRSFFEVDKDRLAKASLEATRAAAKQAVRSVAKRKVFNREVASTNQPSDFFTDWDSTGRIIMEEPDKDPEIVDQALRNDSIFYDKSKFKAEVQTILRREQARKAEVIRRARNLPPPWAKTPDLTLNNANMEPISKDSSVVQPAPKSTKLLDPEYLKKDGGEQ